MRELLPRKHAALVGFDSDGCVFDTMGLKHRECFCPPFIGRFGLQAVSKAAREVWEFVNLDSATRGVNRFKAVLVALDLLKNHPESISRGFSVPDLPILREWVSRTARLSEASLKAELAEHPSDELRLVMDWSADVNTAVAHIARIVPPFPRVAEVISAASRRADVMVVSQTPMEAIVREWTENEIIGDVWTVAGQEFGSKTDQLRAGMSLREGPALMIGDAPGDLAAAREAGASFFPIIPGQETESWRLLADSVLFSWLDGRYSRNQEDELIAKFNAALPDRPVWKKQ